MVQRRSLKPLIRGNTPLTETTLRVDIEFGEDLPVTDADFERWDRIGKVPPRVYLRDVEVGKTGERTLVTVITREEEMNNPSLDILVTRIREIAGNDGPKAVGPMASEPMRIVLSSVVTGQAGLPRPLRSSRPVVKIQVMGEVEPPPEEIERRARDEISERVDIRRAAAGYAIFPAEDHINQATALTIRDIIQEARESVREPTLVYLASESNLI